MEKSFDKKKAEVTKNRLILLFIVWVLLLMMLLGVFINRILHERRMDKIWDKYEQDMDDLHNNKIAEFRVVKPFEFSIV